MVTESAIESWKLRARALLSAALALLLSACVTTGYLVQAAHGQAQLLARRRPLNAVIDDPRTASSLRAQLEMVRSARDFAVRELALPDNRSYRSYADIGRPYVVWNVVATPEFSVEPRHWCWPFTGCLSYRGYFRETGARRFAAALARRGDDVLVAGIAAYSTLGHFNDPVMSSMLRQGGNAVVATMFHELAHQLLYVRDDTEFNEAFAMTVEQEGLARWFASQGREQELDAYLVRRRRQAVIAGIFSGARGELAALYRSGLPPAEMRPRKRELLGQAGQEVLDFARASGTPSGYESWIAAGLNNAHLAAVSTYFDCIPGFQRLLAENDGDLPRFYAAAQALGKGPREHRRALCTGGTGAAGAEAFTAR
jgi:predicted aminopeptidase